MPKSSNPFTEIFKRLTAVEFMEDPTRILSLMMDFGFDSRQIKILRMVMSEDMKEVREFLECTVDSEDEVVGNISEYCLVSRKALTNMLGGIKSSMYGGIETKIIDDKEYGKCRISADGVAKYSLDMTELLHVDDVDSFVIPSSVAIIKDGWIMDSVFRDCESLKEVYIPDSVTEIGECAFSWCKSLVKVHIPDSVTVIRDGVFWMCESLKEVHIPDSVTAIENGAFMNCESLKKIWIPDSVTRIEENAFSGCSSLEEIHIPDSVKVIEKGVFECCESLNVVYIPDSVTEIRDQAFQDCKSLHEVIIPTSTTIIGSNAFDDTTIIMKQNNSNNPTAKSVCLYR
ncbi:leucine-rich repeat domain-containing protein [Candidatus Methanarcanum hacksteinii]|uniref:leucine-rich repeat domain-containing protein n=1 Tax=Candidatus Methanarcanum hacksteinii TaxID=2911857 RepID=UPI0037DDA5DF